MKKINLSKFAPIGTKDCQSMCDRVVVKTKDGLKIVCLACKRIVLEKN